MCVKLYRVKLKSMFKGITIPMKCTIMQSNDRQLADECMYYYSNKLHEPQEVNFKKSCSKQSFEYTLGNYCNVIEKIKDKETWLDFEIQKYKKYHF